MKMRMYVRLDCFQVFLLKKISVDCKRPAFKLLKLILRMKTEKLSLGQTDIFNPGFDHDEVREVRGGARESVVLLLLVS
jgi:hypothetical protein